MFVGSAPDERRAEIARDDKFHDGDRLTEVTPEFAAPSP
jgi:hypothetical protein